MTEVFDFINSIIEQERMKANDININEPEKEQEPEQTKRGRPKKAAETTSSEEEAKPAKKVGRPIAEWRHGPDGKYNSCAIDPEYAKKYFNEHLRKPWTCPVCEKTLKTCGPAIHKHKNSLHCQLAKLKKQQQTPPSN